MEGMCEEEEGTEILVFLVPKSRGRGAALGESI